MKKTGGRITCNGEEVEDLSKFRSRTAFVPQEDVMHRELTVLENVTFSADIRLPVDWTPEMRFALCGNQNFKAPSRASTSTPSTRRLVDGGAMPASQSCRVVAEKGLVKIRRVCPTHCLISTQAARRSCRRSTLST